MNDHSKIEEVSYQLVCYDEAMHQKLMLHRGPHVKKTSLLNAVWIIASFVMIVLLNEQKEAGIKMDMKLELVPIPVSDIERAKAFYAEKVGFHVDHDVQPGNGMRVVQLTPPGSSCSIVIGSGMGEISAMPPGTIKALHLVVVDIAQAREELASRGVEVGEIADVGGGVKYVSFSDPDGNSWLLQEISLNR